MKRSDRSRPRPGDAVFFKSMSIGRIFSVQGDVVVFYHRIEGNFAFFRWRFWDGTLNKYFTWTSRKRPTEEILYRRAAA